ncbi:Acetyl-CoA carboxylase 1 [Dendrobium catenatum]|uniref:Acetyl-CoA carboxylase 1 n=1 Tax=Dendrobium catenatum TaxID=906689 RepID=A0A2I0X213_9ASPA|nr:Acetyl-CoA carboxylase 1 [Dendrobium catenatum]
MIISCYDHNSSQAVQDLLNCLESPEPPFLQWQVLSTRLPKDQKNELDAKYKGYETISSYQKNIEFPAKSLRAELEFHLSSCSKKEKVTLERLVEPLMSLVKSHEGGRESHACVIVRSLFEEYFSVDELFSDTIQADVNERLRLQYLLKIVDSSFQSGISHQGVRSKNKLILRLMESLIYPNLAALRDQLIRFSALNHTISSKLALKSSQLLEQTKLSELCTSNARSVSELVMFTEEGERVRTPRR